MKQSDRHFFFDRRYILLCISSFLFFASFNCIIPELPEFLTSLGGEEYKGYIISLFTLAALISRPYSGKLADTIGRIPVMIFGAVVCVFVSLFYTVFPFLYAFFLLRFFHGFSTGFKPTGNSAYIADIIPSHQRGEAVGLMGLFSSLGMAVGPATGSWIAAEFSLDMVFYYSSLLAGLSILILLGLKETVQEPESFKWSLLKIKRKEILYKRVYSPAFFVFLTLFSFGAVLTLAPDFAVHLGAENKGLYYGYFTVTSILSRYLSGRISDRIGREKVLIAASMLLAASMFVTAMAEDLFTFYTGAVIFGLGVGSNTPIVIAWTIDLSEDKFRGRAMATMYIALELGIGLGAWSSAFIYANQPTQLFHAFGFTGVMAILGGVFLIVRSFQK